MKSLMTILPKHSGRSHGTVSVRHQGGRQKRFLRDVDFRREKLNIWAKVISIEYDPNRNASIALVSYSDGEKRYILAPLLLKEGQKVISGENSPLEVGNALPVRKIPIGTLVHNLEIRPGKGGQMVKSAGTAAVIQGREKEFVLVKLPSGEIRRFHPDAMATIGQIGNIEKKGEVIGKAGRARHMGIRPTVRGTAQHPGSHPHGGGEGRSGVGLKYPKTYAGRMAVGKTRNRKKYSNSMIAKRRPKGKH
jgi:large subunit ribosomal protein L2